jgi:hypothetical protein
VESSVEPSVADRPQPSRAGGTTIYLLSAALLGGLVAILAASMRWSRDSTLWVAIGVIVLFVVFATPLVARDDTSRQKR